ncbi:MAG: EFR1 family ferrodoxin [Treponema sp.]|jgi:ferredoxin|nr:EFR1 family ferrodoxin [Treponema sp.]
MTTIYFFSGTGNTLWSARQLAAQLGARIGEPCELRSIGVEARAGRYAVSADAVVFLFPAYAYEPPPLVTRFIKKCRIDAPYAAALVTFGSSPGGSLARVQGLLRKKRIPSLYFGRVPTVENYIAIFGPPTEAKLRDRGAMQTRATEEAACAIAQRRVNKVPAFRPLSFVAFLFSAARRIFYHWYRVSKKTCTGCGICAKVCPVGAIRMHKGRPRFSAACEHCQGCLNWCPNNAINFGRINARTPRYHHPGVSLKEMLDAAGT